MAHCPTDEDADTGQKGEKSEGPRIIAIKAKKFEFSPREIPLKKGESVILRLTSLDRPHGFFLKPLKIDIDIAPGRTTDVARTANTVGEYQDVWSAQSAGPGIKASRERYM